MRSIACRFLMVIAIFGFCASLTFGQTIQDPLSGRVVLALVAGNALSENIVHEIEARGLAFHPSEQFRNLATDAGADTRIIVALNNAKTIGADGNTENNENQDLLQHLAKAGKLLRTKEYEQATRELSAALQSGGGAETGFVMGEVLRQQENWAGAQDIYEGVQRRAPEFPEAQTKLSYILYRLGDGEGSLNEARIALAENQNDAEAHKNAGLALQILKRFAAAEQEYGEALRLKPDYKSVRRDLALLFSDEGKYDQAVAEFKKAIALDAADWLPHYNLGIAYDGKGDLDSAIREYREAKRLNPTVFDPRVNLGHDLMAQNMYAEAVKELRELETLAPDSPVCHRCLGNALYGTWDFHGAEEEYRIAIGLDPSDAMPHVGLGNIRTQQKNYDAAVEEFHLAERLDPAFFDAYLNAGFALSAKQDYSGAVRELKQAERLKPSSVRAHYYYGQALVGLGDTSTAIGQFKQAIALDPKQADIRIELANALEKNDNWVDSLDQYHQAAMIDPNPGNLDKYKTAQARFNQHIATLKASGKSAEAAALNSNVRSSRVEPNMSERLDSLMQDGQAAMVAQRFEEADRKYKEAVDLAGKLQPPDDRLASALNSLGGLYGRKNDFVHAEAALQRALKVTEDLHGADSPAMTMPLQNLGFYSLFRQDFHSAFDFFSQAVAVNEKAFGENSDNVARSLIYLASVYIAQRDYAKAEPYLLRATKIDESLFGAEAPGMNLVLSSLCDLYSRWDKPEKAEPRYKQLLAAVEKQFGPDSPVLLTTLVGESKALHELGRTEEARKIDQRLLTIRAATGQPEGQPSAQIPK